MAKIEIPEELALIHGGSDIAAMGAKMVETFRLWGGLKAEDAILDIGCGPGRMAIAIGDRFDWFNPYNGFEIKREDIEFCQQYLTSAHPNFVFHHLDIYNSHYHRNGTIQPTEVIFPAEDNSIDFCFATSIFTHMFPEETAHYFQEIGRVVRDRVFTTWFVIDDLFEKGLAAGNSRLEFAYEGPMGSRYRSDRSPLDAVGHTWSAIEDYHQAAGMVIEKLHRGAWTGQVSKQEVRHSQDVVVARSI